jgi:4-hydroxy 2-oxovalerate aldolase
MKILDCTLRDGGYYTNWDFENRIVSNYIESFNHLPVEYIEIGYRSKAMQGYLGEYFYCPVHVVEEIFNNTNKKLVVIINEKDVAAEDASELLHPIKPFVKMVRLAVDPENFERALVLGESVKKLGFELAFNVMYMSNWKSYPSLMDNLSKLEGLADYLYMVDSFGGVFPEDVRNIIKEIRLRTKIPLGFHGHNNLELALINSLVAVENGVEMIDATITGMGRGAGNLKMELLLSVLNAKGLVDFDYNYLSKLTDDFAKLQTHYGWGTNLPYMVSGANSLPQKQVMEWVGKRFYSFNSILRALSNQSKGLKDNRQLPQVDFGSSIKYTGAVIIGGGNSVVLHAKSLSAFLRSRPDIALIHSSSRNAMIFKGLPNDQYFCLVGNEGHRLEEVFGDSGTINGKCILPPYPRKMGTYIPDSVINKSYELQNINFTDKLKDTHTALALQTAVEFGISKVFVVGYDGYYGASMGQKEQEFFQENEYLFDKVGQVGIDCISLTPTKYKNIIQDSLFAYFS